ncbi:cob(I)yrinic acid a,c-diamide adenosyltransferase [Thermovirga sp.]|uniref:Cob(I)yrinic acid a,c-diamide adenosyltransferase n=1 Tax=candidate division WOR-3 bacterium TaxID=2052148 RepID=A0A7C5HEG2_UNCW3|nr:cob(I)yrinic acid a,c-diamide adenosyltransferase [Thermovirga sp.]MBO8153197.1 cob(I)yrinic acid a,c-diamide adenosyltransferase [Thermovirga sp.]MCD6182922.1 cob(I)yrinic acid a,c-diamide adenosyltransferase [Thermovirga sp.]HHE04832.1 cob(I)yrinic acid a,c-diamide adenosyltransferase [candidate division WOR-3 bacterium]
MSYLEKGLIHVYTGNGKGKTTAALGLALRAAGHGAKVSIIQFMKGWPYYGEIEGLKKFSNITHYLTGRPDFVDRANPDPEDYKGAEEGLRLAKEAITSGEYDLVVLDEINVVLDYGLLKLEEVLEIIKKRPTNVEIVLTGRNAPKQLIDEADYVTEMVEVKHPYAKGCSGRKCIEY